MVRPVISSYQQLNNYQPRVAVIEDIGSPASKKVLELIKQSGGKAMIIPRYLSDRLLASQDLSKQQISRIKNAKSWEDVREFDQQIATATRLHLQYITRKLTFIDAIVLPGNHFDIPPSAYHETLVHQRTHVAPPMDVRFQTELVMAEYALHSRKIPILGISAGMQLLVVKTGGKLIQHIAGFDDFERQILSSTQASSANKNNALEKISFANSQLVAQLSPHFKVVQPRSIIGVMMSTEEFLKKSVNSLEAVHLNHQAVRPQDVNSGELLVTALTEDGNYVEAVEHTNHPFCLGIQFHPEYNSSLGVRMIKEMVDYARQLKSSQFDAKVKIPTYVELHEADVNALLTAQSNTSLANNTSQEKRA